MRNKLEHPVFLAALGAAGLLLGAFGRAPGASTSPSAADQGRIGQGSEMTSEDHRGGNAA